MSSGAERRQLLQHILWRNSRLRRSRESLKSHTKMPKRVPYRAGTRGMIDIYKSRDMQRLSDVRPTNRRMYSRLNSRNVSGIGFVLANMTSALILAFEEYSKLDLPSLPRLNSREALPFSRYVRVPFSENR